MCRAEKAKNFHLAALIISTTISRNFVIVIFRLFWWKIHRSRLGKVTFCLAFLCVRALSSCWFWLAVMRWTLFFRVLNVDVSTSEPSKLFNFLSSSSLLPSSILTRRIMKKWWYLIFSTSNNVCFDVQFFTSSLARSTLLSSCLFAENFTLSWRAQYFFLCYEWMLGCKFGKMFRWMGNEDVVDLTCKNFWRYN